MAQSYRKRNYNIAVSIVHDDVCAGRGGKADRNRPAGPAVRSRDERDPAR